jgi:2-amino-4-hydroxy-6-hydroxymethyldihydropteridine diphosphokinase
MIHDQNHVVYLALGTNLGDRAANLKAAIAALGEAVEVQAVSAVYETPPWGVTDQPAFLNQALKGTTNLPPLELLKFLKDLEPRLGRQPGMRWGPRLIDLDILFYDDLVYEAEGLRIPHPRIAERAFVLKPLADIAADLKHPVTGKSVQEMLDEVGSEGINQVKAS